MRCEGPRAGPAQLLSLQKAALSAVWRPPAAMSHAAHAAPAAQVAARMAQPSHALDGGSPGASSEHHADVVRSCRCGGRATGRLVAVQWKRGRALLDCICSWEALTAAVPPAGFVHLMASSLCWRVELAACKDPATMHAVLAAF